MCNLLLVTSLHRLKYVQTDFIASLTTLHHVLHNKAIANANHQVSESLNVPYHFIRNHQSRRHETSGSQEPASKDERGTRKKHTMISLVAFDLDGTLALSKQPLQPPMIEHLATLLTVAHVAVISGGDWPQFEKQVASRLPPTANLSNLWLMPTTGTKLYTWRKAATETETGPETETGTWQPVYAELFTPETRASIIAAFHASLEATGFVPEQTWGERIEDRGSQITFSALGQQAPVHAKEIWDPDFAKRKIIQADLRQRLPGLSINMGGATSIDITKEGVDKGYGLRRLSVASGIPLEQMMFIGDAIFPGGNDYPAKEMGMETVCVRDPEGTLAAVAAITACLRK